MKTPKAIPVFCKHCGSMAAILKTKRSGWSPLTWSVADWLGILGLLVAAILGFVTLHDRYELRGLRLDIGRVEVRSGDYYEREARSPTLVFPIYHFAGRPIFVESVQLVVRHQQTAAEGWHSTGGFSRDEGIWELNDTEILAVCSRCESALCQNPNALPDEDKEAPTRFESGQTRRCMVTLATVWPWSHVRRDGQFAAIQVLSQGKVVARFDVSQEIRRARVHQN